MHVNTLFGIAGFIKFSILVIEFPAFWLVHYSQVISDRVTLLLPYKESNFLKCCGIQNLLHKFCEARVLEMA